MTVRALRIPLEPGKYYHVYNRGNNKEKIFFNPGDYRSFLINYYQFIYPYVDTYAYCMLPNHFHFLIKIKFDKCESHRFISNQFRRVFIKHALRINSMQGRKGCLLYRNFRRIQIEDENYLLNVVKYIHYNPLKHGISDSISNYQYSSFNSYVHNYNPIINSEEVLEWFGGLDQFLQFHDQQDSNLDLIGLSADD